MCDTSGLCGARGLLSGRVSGYPAMGLRITGPSTFTYSDVERAIKQQVRARNFLAFYELRAAEELRSAEMAVLQRLERKYRAPSASSPKSSEAIAPLNAVIEAVAEPAGIQQPLSHPIQQSLF